MPDGLDLDAYFRRIGYDGPRQSTLATLAAIHARHVAAIPFENLDPLLGRPVLLDLPALQAKLVGQRRGGYCFEQNLLLQAVLDALGFRVTGLAARVRWRAPPERPLGPRTHMLLQVQLPEGPYIADVGFGARLLDAPLRLEGELEQETPGARYRITAASVGVFALSTWLPSGWQLMYLFDLSPQVQADYEMGSWFTSTHPLMWFRKSLIVERVTPQARYTLTNLRLVEQQRDELVRERTIADARELERVLDEVFGVTAPAGAEAVFAKLSESA